MAAPVSVKMVAAETAVDWQAVDPPLRLHQ